MSHPITEELKSLHTASIDALNGYEEARKDAEGKGMSPLFQEMITMHTKNAGDLAAELHARGEQADSEGSFMSTVNRTIMDVRSLFGGLGESVLPGLIDGEKRNLHHYDRVMQAPDVTGKVNAILEVNRARIEGAIAKMEALDSRPVSEESRQTIV
jgi:uncharacterized protein (TIGR02284 family)